MKIRIAHAVLASVSMLAPLLIIAQAPAQDGATLLKAKCAACHGAEGQGKPPMAPKLAGTTKSEAEIAAVLTKGGEPKAPHIKPMSSVTPEQATALAAFVKTMK